MKRSVMALLALMLLMFTACAPQNTNAPGNENVTKKDLVGNYEDVSLRDPLSIQTDMLAGSHSLPVHRDTLIIEYKDDSLVYQDDSFSGVCELNNDGSVLMKRKKVIAEGWLANLAELTMEQVPIMFYTYYNDYLISHLDMGFSILSGQLPEGKKTDCFLSLEHTTLTSYWLTFSEEGTCEMEAIGVGYEKYYFKGTYECDGKIVLLTFTEGSIDDQKYNGESKMVLYIDEGKIYNSVYKKK